VRKRDRCLYCDALDHHEQYVSLLTPAGRYLGYVSVCAVCVERVGKGGAVAVVMDGPKRYRPT